MRKERNPCDIHGTPFVHNEDADQRAYEWSESSVVSVSNQIHRHHDLDRMYLFL